MMFTAMDYTTQVSRVSQLIFYATLKLMEANGFLEQSEKYIKTAQQSVEKGQMEDMICS